MDAGGKSSIQRIQGRSAAEVLVVFGPGGPSHCCQVNTGHSHFSQAAMALLPGVMQRGKARVNHGCLKSSRNSGHGHRFLVYTSSSSDLPTPAAGL